MGTFGLSGLGNVEGMAQQKMAQARRLAQRVGLGSSRVRSAPPLDLIAQIEKLMGEAIGIYEGAGMASEAARARAEADELSRTITNMVRGMSRVRGGSRGGTISMRSRGSYFPPRGRMGGTFGLSGLGAGADVHERKYRGALGRAYSAQQRAMSAGSMDSFLESYGEAMQAYGEALGHLSSVMGRVTEVVRLESEITAAARAMRASRQGSRRAA